MNVILTGGAGFIGSSLSHRLASVFNDINLFILDKLTYAGNIENIRSLIDQHEAISFIHADVNDKASIHEIIEEIKPDLIIHAAAESHVDRSIEKGDNFIETNIKGTINLLEAVRRHSTKKTLFYHISTDEVFGSLDNTGLFKEESPYAPQSPYAASKASSDHMVRAYSNTYGVRYLISNCSNNYGPRQFPEKLIPLFLSNIIERKKLPVYGDGSNVRDWLYVEDHADAIIQIIESGIENESFNIGGNNEWTNLDLVYLLCDLMDEKLGRKKGESRGLISFVEDRKGHDKRYAIDNSKIKSLIGWKPKVSFEEGISSTVDWYLNNKSWLENIKSGKYLDLNDQYRKPFKF